MIAFVPPNSKKRAAIIASQYGDDLEARRKPRFITNSFTPGQARIEDSRY
jgi:hypothetical protein